MTEQELMRHIKALTPRRMTVFIESPFYWEKQVRNNPRAPFGGEVFVREDKEGNRHLTRYATYLAGHLIERMTREAEFFVAQRERLAVFYRDYRKEAARLGAAYDRIREQRMKAVRWNDHAVLFRQECDLKQRRDTLFRRMYDEAFAPRVPFIDEQRFRSLQRRFSASARRVK